MAEERTLEVGDQLIVKVIPIAMLKEADLNAQVMQPRHFDRLAENIRQRGQVESLPYAHQPNGEGPIQIVSGHHRARAARQAGLTEIPILLDTRPMKRSEVIAKQIAHNELHGSADEEILAQLVQMIDNVDDLLLTGLPDDWLPTLSAESTALQLPHASFEWRTVILTFLPDQFDQFQDLATKLDKADTLGAAPVDQFDDFVAAMRAYGIANDIRSMGTTVAHLTALALRELEQHEKEPDDGR